MSLLLDVLFAAHARSTHHKLALDALEHLSHPNSDAWRTTFLSHYSRYLAGAKDPDDRFKDFRNHVLHVRQEMWGGAIKSAKKWYEQSIEEFRRRNWAEGVYSAGVLSHYFTDPVQPFHTHQSEIENNIHRAFEWSTTKSYEELRNLLDQRFGYPIIEVGEGEDWLGDLIERGARLSNKFYESLIDHYDFYRGSRNPPEGFDDFCRVSLSRLVGWATVGFARVLDRLFEEAEVNPPPQGLTMATFMATLEMPIQWILKKMSDSRERILVEQMYAEYQATGRVDAHLPEDDRTIRDLVAEQGRKNSGTGTGNRKTISSESVSAINSQDRIQARSIDSGRSAKVAEVVGKMTSVETEFAIPGGLSGVGNKLNQARRLEPANVGSSLGKKEIRRDPPETKSDTTRGMNSMPMLSTQSQMSSEEKTNAGNRVESSTGRGGSIGEAEYRVEMAPAPSRDMTPASGEEAATIGTSGTKSTSVIPKLAIPQVAPLDFEIQTESIPEPHVRFDDSTFGIHPEPNRQRTDCSDNGISDFPPFEFGDDETRLQRLDAAHGGGPQVTASPLEETDSNDAFLKSLSETERDSDSNPRARLPRERTEFLHPPDRRSDGHSGAEDGRTMGTQAKIARENREYDVREGMHSEERETHSEEQSDRTRNRKGEKGLDQAPGEQKARDREEEVFEGQGETFERSSRDHLSQQKRDSREERSPRYYLEMDSPIVDAPSIGPKTAKRLKGCRIRTVSDLIQADPESLATALKTSHITAQVIRDWQDQARLVYGIPDLRGNDAQLLVACNVRDARRVAEADWESLAQRIDRFSKSPAGQRILRNSASPDANEVSEWIANAQGGRGFLERDAL